MTLSTVPLFQRLRRPLSDEWDPHDAAPHEVAHGTYDADIAPPRQLIEAGGTEDQAVEFRHEREKVWFP